MSSCKWTLGVLSLTVFSSVAGCVAATSDNQTNAALETDHGVVSCRMAGTMAFAPPLTLSSMSTVVTLSGVLSTCVVVGDEPFGISGGTAAATLTGIASKLVANLSGEVNIIYNLVGGGTFAYTREITCLVGEIGVYSCEGVLIDEDLNESVVEMTPVVPSSQFLGGPTSQVTFVDAGMAGPKQ